MCQFLPAIIHFEASTLIIKPPFLALVHLSALLWEKKMITSIFFMVKVFLLWQMDSQ